MTWIRVDTALTRHPKIARFAKAMDMNRHEAIGVLVDLWAWSVDYAENGDLTRYSSAELLTSLSISGGLLPGEPDLLGALEESGLADRQDGTLVLHDWDDHQGQLIAQREKNRERQRRYAQRRKEEALANAAKPLDNGATNVTNEHNEPTNVKPRGLMLEWDGLKPITEADCQRWRDLFPRLNIDVEVEKMRQYLEAAPKSRKPKASLPRFATNWLQRAQKEVDREQAVIDRDRRKQEQRQQEVAKQLEDLTATKTTSPEAIARAKQQFAGMFTPKPQKGDKA